MRIKNGLTVAGFMAYVKRNRGYLIGIAFSWCVTVGTLVLLSRGVDGLGFRVLAGTLGVVFGAIFVLTLVDLFFLSGVKQGNYTKPISDNDYNLTISNTGVTVAGGSGKMYDIPYSRVISCRIDRLEYPKVYGKLYIVPEGLDVYATGDDSLNRELYIKNTGKAPLLYHSVACSIFDYPRLQSALEFMNISITGEAENEVRKEVKDLGVL